MPGAKGLAAAHARAHLTVKLDLPSPELSLDHLWWRGLKTGHWGELGPERLGCAQVSHAIQPTQARTSMRVGFQRNVNSRPERNSQPTTCCLATASLTN